MILASLYFFDNDRLTKIIKFCKQDTNDTSPTLVIVVTRKYVSFFPFLNNSIQRFCNVYSQAAHFGAVLAEARSSAYGDLGAKALRTHLSRS